MVVIVQEKRLLDASGRTARDNVIVHVDDPTLFELINAPRYYVHT